MVSRNSTRGSTEDAARIRQSLDYAREYYHQYPDRIDFIIENSLPFYLDLSKHWKQQWYCAKCHKWLPVSIEQCSCASWQSESIHRKNLLKTPNPKIDDCFALLSTRLQAKSYPRLRFINESDDNLYFALMEAQGINDKQEIISCMKRVVEKILFHLGISTNSVGIRILVLEQDDSSGVVGTYERRADLHGEIVIKIIQHHFVDTCISIACHECMHHFLWVNGIWKKNEKENEFLTDIAMIYCGIIGTIVEGYHQYPQKGGTYKVGYIQQNEIAYASAFYIEQRESYIREQQSVLTSKMHLLENTLQYNENLFSKSTALEKASSITVEMYDLLAQNAAFIQYGEGVKVLSGLRGVPALDDETPEAVIQGCQKDIDACLVRLSSFNKQLRKIVCD